MDIIDVMLARALTPQGQIEHYAELAESAIVSANRAVTAAENAVTTAESVTADAATASRAAEAAANQASTIMTNINTTINTEVKKLLVDLSSHAITDGIGYNLITTYPDNTARTVEEVIKLYTTTGTHTDGSMTQKAISDKFTEIETAIANIDPSQGGGSSMPTNLGPENAGQIVIVGPDGTIVAGLTAEEDIINALMKSGDYSAKNAVGLTIDYANRSTERTQEAVNLDAGAEFNQYSMYGGRMRCNVSDDGTIVAWYGDYTYRDDGSNGQVMIYQPKFYYSRLPLATDELTGGGKIIRKESIIISENRQPGFKLHPIFKKPNGEELEYVLISAYEGSLYRDSIADYDLADGSAMNLSTDKLSSIANAKPISGVNKQLTPLAAEQLAANRGEGWHITNLAAESMLQMLQIVEFGTLNGQEALESGIVNMNNVASYNCAAITGSTASLGNTTGHATSTIGEINGTRTTYTNAGQRAISYRGMENPWGNIWRMIGGVNIVGNGYDNGGRPYLCQDFNYTTTTGDNYRYIGFMLPSIYDWVSGFGYNKPDYDWVFLPAECVGANSAVPIGDNLWTTASLNGTNTAMIGGAWSFGDNCGPFYYALEKNINSYARAYSARLMFIPTKNAIYTANYNDWKAKMGG